jgi:hypothetical protein
MSNRFDFCLVISILPDVHTIKSEQHKLFGLQVIQFGLELIAAYFFSYISYVKAST